MIPKNKVNIGKNFGESGAIMIDRIQIYHGFSRNKDLISQERAHSDFNIR